MHELAKSKRPADEAGHISSSVTVRAESVHPQMALLVITDASEGLLNSIYDAMDSKHVRTWEYQDHENVRYFTHITPDKQWHMKAWFKPSAQAGRLTLNIIKPKGHTISTEVYAVYHGRFIEMLLAHFDKQFTQVIATASAQADDRV